MARLDNIHADPVPELETVRQRLLDAVDFDLNIIDFMLLDTGGVSPRSEVIILNGGVIDFGGMKSRLYGHIHLMRNLSCYLVKGESGYKADDALRNEFGNCNQIWFRELW